MKRISRSYPVELIIAGVLVLVAGFIYFNRQYLADTISVWQYEPSQVMESLAKQGGLNSKGNFYLFAAKPTLLSSVDFSFHCSTKDASAAVLGCYKDDRIYIYNVENDKLEGIKTVTTAHEMLHVAYSRLSSADKDRINQLLEKEYAKLKNDTSFKERMEFYQKFEPGERDNELHSIVATEVKTIDPELEEYYSRYFDDRQKVISHHDNYITAFTSLQNKSDKLVKTLNSLADSIKTRTKQYNRSVSDFNQRVANLNQRANSNYFSSYSQYETQKQALIAESSQLSSTSRSINADIKKYNKLKTRLEKLGSQYEELTDSLDSTIVESPDSIKAD
ncbi:MAG: hypothetical protein L0H36_02695 [bacterium]|nr:hypothetical protein [bacterium]MDN5835520.1 hypothetical protein [bacterium]